MGAATVKGFACESASVLTEDPLVGVLNSENLRNTGITPQNSACASPTGSLYSAKYNSSTVIKSAYAGLLYQYSLYASYICRQSKVKRVDNQPFTMPREVWRSRTSFVPIRLRIAPPILINNEHAPSELRLRRRPKSSPLTLFADAVRAESSPTLERGRPSMASTRGPGQGAVGSRVLLCSPCLAAVLRPASDDGAGP